ncbi:MAG TPA: AAA family ATPase [Candidatus Tyrphobacter sp.]
MSSESAASFNPFPGLRPFEDDAADISVFFGRDDQVDELLERLHHGRFVGIVGQSGCGKSSLVRAGLLPALHGGFMAGAGSRWRIAVMRPGSAPIESLARSLERAGVLENVAQDEAMRLGLTHGVLHGGALGLVEVVQQAHLPQDENVLVVVDQFEELFRFRHGASAAHASDEAAAFVKLLLSAASHRDVPIYVLVTMRSDFIGECAQFRDLPETLNDGLFLVPRLTRDQLREAIEGPVGVAGATIAPRLVNRLLNELGDDPDQLPVLQHALMRTWDLWASEKKPDEAIDVRHYEATGGLAAALSRHGDEILKALGAGRLRLVAQRVFKALTERGGDNRGVRRPTEFAQLCAIADAKDAEVRSVVEAFRAPGVSFLMPPPDVAIEASTIIDLSHEALMRTWVALRTWVDEEAEAAKLYRRLVSDADLREEKLGALLGGPLLSFAEEWRDRDHPTAAWAERYGGGLERVRQLILDSRAALDAEAWKKEESERRERENELRRAEERTEIERMRGVQRLAQRTRRLAIVMSVIALVAVAASVWALAAGRRASQQAQLAQIAEGKAVVAAQQAEHERAAALYQRGVAIHQTTIARSAEAKAQREAEIARQQAHRADIAVAQANAARAQLALYAQEQGNKADSLQLAQLDRGMYQFHLDNRVAGLLGTTAYALNRTADARAQLLNAGYVIGALGRVAMPPWNLGAVIGRGRTIAVLTGARQGRYAQPVTGALLSVDASTLAIRARTPGVRATLMCGFDGESRVAIATESGIDLYDVASRAGPARIASRSAGMVRALACLPSGERVAYVADGMLRTAAFDARNANTIARVGGDVNGIVLSRSGRYGAITTTNGEVAVYDLVRRRVVEISRLLPDTAHDCSAVAGCAGAVAFTWDEAKLVWYDAGSIHVAPLSAAADDAYACPASICAHPTLMYLGPYPLPNIVADGGVLEYDEGTAKAYKVLYNDEAGSQRRPLLDREFNMYVTPYDPKISGQPNPFGSGLATQSFAPMEGPILGRMTGPQWSGSYGILGHHLLIPGEAGFIAFDLDHLRAGFGNQRNNGVSYHVQIRGCGDGAHAVTFNYVTGEVEVLDIRSSSPRIMHRFRLAPVPTVNRNGNHYYTYEVRVAYDPSSQIVTELSYPNQSSPSSVATQLRRLSADGRILANGVWMRERLAERAGVAPTAITGVILSARGNYIVLKVSAPQPDVLLRSDGTRIGRAFSIDGLSGDERFAIVQNAQSDLAETIYRLPAWMATGITSIPRNAQDIEMSPDGSTVAYAAQISSSTHLYLYDTASRLTYPWLPDPPGLQGFGGVGIGDTFSFSRDNRYLVAQYHGADYQYYLAVYALDPRAWARSACLMAGRSLTAQEFHALAGNGVTYRNGCAPYLSEMYRW